jgi:acetolactate synthase-1/2/3 large subunit
MAQVTGAEAFVRMLQLHGVKHVFGLCGDTSLPLYDALARLDHGIAHVLTRDERSAAYMADGYARVSGRVGVCEGPSGGGATYILPGVVEANESSVPVLCFTSDVSVAARGRFALTELDQAALFRPLTKWNAMLNAAPDIPRTLRRAFTEMTVGRSGAVHVGLPYDVQRQPLDDMDVWADATLGAYPARRSGPDAAGIEDAARRLVAARRPLFVVGGGAILSGAERQLLACAETLGAPVATTISGKGSLPETHPLAVGVVGSNGGTPPTRAIVEAADLVFFVGCRAGSVTTERWRFPAPGTAEVIHLDVDPRVIGANYPTAVGLVGDAKLALVALRDALVAHGPDASKGWGREAAAKANSDKLAAFGPLAASEEVPIRPERLVAELQHALPADAIVVADPGTPCPYLSAHYRVSQVGRTYFSNRAHGALGYALSAAVGAYFGRPTAKVVAVMGDGSFAMTVGELETVVRRRVPLTMVVVSNATYGWIKAGQKAGFGSRYFSVDFGRTDHAAVAAAFGVRSWRVEDPAQLAGALASALASGEPSLVDVVCQPLHEARAPVSEWIA